MLLNTTRNWHSERSLIIKHTLYVKLQLLPAIHWEFVQFAFQQDYPNARGTLVI